MSRHVPQHTFRCPPPPLRVMVARPAQVTEVTQVPIGLTQHDTAAALCDTTHPMWRHRGMARPKPPPPPPPWLGKLQYLWWNHRSGADSSSNRCASSPLRP